LANAVQTAINANAVQNGSSVSVSISGGKLAVTSDKYGTTSTVSGISGTALSALGFAGSESATGTDVAGSFIVNGVTETATGSGQVLTGNSGNTNTSGLVVVVSYTPSQILAGGTDSTLTVTKGLASTLNDTLESLLDPSKGLLAEIGNQYTQSIADANKEVSDAQAALDAQKTSLLQQFAALETTLANLQSTSSLLTSAFASLSSSNSSSSSSATPRVSTSSSS
jgi:flagellar hook-associated protein 2